jgi:hypothetical protein
MKSWLVAGTFIYTSNPASEAQLSFAVDMKCELKVSRSHVPLPVHIFDDENTLHVMGTISLSVRSTYQIVAPAFVAETDSGAEEAHAVMTFSVL